MNIIKGGELKILFLLWSEMGREAGESVPKSNLDGRHFSKELVDMKDLEPEVLKDQSSW